MAILASLAYGAGAMYWTMEDPFGFWPCIGGLASTEAAAIAFFFESEYSPKDPRTGIFCRFRPAGTGFDLALRRWMVLPDFSI